MVYSYFIKYIHNEISVQERRDDKFHYIKKNGEKDFPFESDIFWRWFKEKIAYREELELSFVVLTDQDDFAIDDTISLAKKNHFLTDSLAIEEIQEQSAGLKIHTFPKMADFTAIEASNAGRKPDKTHDNTGEGTLAEYFRKETKTYRSK
jgi:hypothetical protein